MDVTVLAPPAAEPLSVAEAKAYLQIAHDDEDGLVTQLIAGARARIEALAGVAMISRTLRAALRAWPKGMVETRRLRLPVNPALQLVAVRRVATGGEYEDVTDRFVLSPGRSARLVWAAGSFPWLARGHRGIEIDYVAGFGEDPEAVAEGLRLALKRMTAHAYHARKSGGEDRVPEDVAGLIAPWRRMNL